MTEYEIGCVEFRLCVYFFDMLAKSSDVATFDFNVRFSHKFLF